MSMTTQQSPHAILFACPLQGHLNPAVHLAIKLASRGFTVTFVNSESTHHQTSKAHSLCGGEDVFATVRGCGLDIRYATVSDGLPVGHDRFSNHDQFMAAMLYVQSAHVEELVAKVVKRSVPPLTCLVADSFFVWPSAIAKKFGLICVSFWPGSALRFGHFCNRDLLRKNSHFAGHGN